MTKIEEDTKQTDFKKYLMSWYYVHRRSHVFYYRLSIILFLFKAAFTLGGLSAFIGPLPIIVISLGALLIEVGDKVYKVSEKMHEFERMAADYRDLLYSFTIAPTDTDAILRREREIKKNSKFYPLETYLRDMRLNGYQYKVEEENKEEEEA